MEIELQQTANGQQSTALSPSAVQRGAMRYGKESSEDGETAI